MLSLIRKSLRPLAFSIAAIVAGFAAATVAPPAEAQERAQDGPASAPVVVVRDYDVFVDIPTAFAFIKLPGGWKFIGKLDAQQLRRLPQGTLTSLLPPEQQDSVMRMAEKAPVPVLVAKAGKTSR